MRTRIISRLIQEAEHRTFSDPNSPGRGREYLLWDDVVGIILEELSDEKIKLECDTKTDILLPKRS